MSSDTIHLFNGYNHDPMIEEHSPSRIPDGHFYIWENGLLRGLPTQRHGWYSGLQGLAGWKRAKTEGGVSLIPGDGKAYNTYGYAYKVLAKRAAIEAIKNAEPGGSALAHSLGTKVVAEILKLKPNFFKNVLCLQGAVHNYDMLPVMYENREVKFLNVAVKTDDVLSKLGRTFGPKFGLHPVIGNGLPHYPGNVEQVCLDDPDQQKYYKEHFGFDLRGNNPDSYGDHSESFEWKGNWDKLRGFLECR